MYLPGRKFDAGTGYRFGFNGKENDNEVKGEGNQQDYGMRIYDPRLGRFLSTDPLTKIYSELTPYQYASNRPIDGIDLDGLEWYKALKDWASNLTIAGLVYNTSNSIKAAANGDQRALVGLVTYTGSKSLEAKDAFGYSGTKDQKEYFLTSIFLDGVTAYALPKLAPKNAPNLVEVATEENGTTPKSNTTAATNKQATAANGGNTNPAANNIEAAPQKVKSADHHIATNKNDISTARGGPWTPRFRTFFDKAGLDINKGSENLVNVINHKGPHPEAYHQLVFDRLSTATKGLKANTNTYKTAVTNTLQAIGTEAQTVGSPVNKLLTKTP